MRVCLLGPLAIDDEGRAIRLSGARQKAVVACLALQANLAVPTELLVTDIWGEESPAESTNALQAAVSRLRRLLPAGRLVTAGGGYLLRLLPGEFDVGTFEQAVRDGEAALERGAVQDARVLLRHALGLWRGQALADFRYEPFAQTHIARLEELHLTCLEARIEADLAAGAGSHVLAELQHLVSDHPLRERVRGQLMRALYQAGRQAEALATYRQLRSLLAGELGLAPSADLVRLESAILRHDLPDGGRASRRDPTRLLITVLYVDVAGRVESGDLLDVEALQGLRTPLVDLLGLVLGRFGGSLFTGPGDQLQGVFGLGTVHEDDAHRAALAAVDVRRQLTDQQQNLTDHRLNTEFLPGVGLTWRIGVATAEALVTGTGPGDVVSEAAPLARRLAESAAPGGILISELTYRLARGALDVTPAPTGYHLRAVHFGARAVPPNVDTPFVGRQSELDRLRHALSATEDARSARLITVLGDAGLGKSRLLHQFTGVIGPAVRSITGRCVAYGDAISLWPLREILLHATGGQLSAEGIVDLLPDAADRNDVAGRLARVVGVGEPGTTDATEVFWAARRLFEALGRHGPLVIVLDDLHWADPAFLDLLQSVVQQPPAAPVLLVCLARHDLVEHRPDWPSLSDTIRLGPLTRTDASLLLQTLLPADPAAALHSTDQERSRLLETADGNPLYLEQLVAWLRDRPAGTRPELPLTIQALLSARLDRLGPAERAVVACAAVLGVEFDARTVASLLPQAARPACDRHVMMLAAKGLVERHPHPDPQGPDHRFRHVLIQQAAYRAIPKSRRAALHEQVADGMSEPDDQDVKTAGMLSHHLEQAALYCRELHDDKAASLARRAVTQLSAAGEAALGVGTASAAASYFHRALRLLPPGDDARSGLLLRLGAAQYEAGDLSAAAGSLRTARDLAGALGDEQLRARAQVHEIVVSLHVDPNRAIIETGSLLPGLTEAFERWGDDAGLSQLWHMRALIFWGGAQAASAQNAWQRAAEHARRSGDQRQLSWVLGWLASAALWGPTPAGEGIARCHEYLQEARLTPTMRAAVLLHQAGMYAMRDDLATACILQTKGIYILDDIGANLPLAITESAALISLLQGDLRAAEQHLRRGYDQLTRMGERDQLATIAAFLARTLALQGRHRHAEAEALVEISHDAGAHQDLSAKMLCLGVQARVLAARGEGQAAVRVARDAVAAAQRTDFLNQHADALIDLADVLDAVGDPTAAQDAARRAGRIYRIKENVIAERRCLARLVPRAETLREWCDG